MRIFSDEIYRGLEYDESTQLQSLGDLSEGSITLGGASKSLGLPGLRFGWLVIKDRTSYKKLLHLKSYTSMCSTQPGDYLELMAIRASKKLIAKNLIIIKENLSVSEQFFEKWRDHFLWLRPSAGSVCVFKVNERSAEAFCIDMADRFGIVLLPTRFMGQEDQFVRIGLGRTNFKRGMDAFDSALNELYK